MTLGSNYSIAIATPVDRVKSFNQWEAKPKNRSFYAWFFPRFEQGIGNCEEFSLIGLSHCLLLFWLVGELLWYWFFDSHVKAMLIKLDSWIRDRWRLSQLVIIAGFPPGRAVPFDITNLTCAVFCFVGFEGPVYDFVGGKYFTWKSGQDAPNRFTNCREEQRGKEIPVVVSMQVKR